MKSPTDQPDPAKPTERARDRFRRVLRVALWISIAVLAAGGVLKFVVAPAVVRHLVADNLPRYWDGHVEIDRVSVGFGSVQLGGVRLYDRQDRLWLAAESVSVSPGVRWTLEAGFRDVDIDALDLRLQFIEGRCDPPLRNVDELVTWLEQVTHIDLLHADGTITLNRPGGAAYTLGPVTMDIRRAVDGHRVHVRGFDEDTRNVLDLDGWANWGTTAFDANVIVRHRLTPADSKALVSVFHVRGVDEGAVTLQADLTLKGRWTLPHTWRPTGTASVSEGHLVVGGEAILDRLAGQFVVTSDANTITAGAERLTARLAGGEFSAKGSLTSRPATSPRTHLPITQLSYRGSVAIDGANITPIARAVAGATGHRRTMRDVGRLGKLKLRYDVKGEGLSPADLQGRGVLRLDQVDLTALPAGPALVKGFHGSIPRAMAMADLEATMDSNGPRVTLQEARLAGPLLAIEIEPGGTLDLQDGTVDLYAVGVPLARLQSGLIRLPLLEILGFLQQSLTRVHIEGNWSETGAINVTVAPGPSNRLGRQSRGFFMKAAREGGKLSGHLIDRFRTMFTTLDLFQPN
ncbi:MAG: hypothetical protein ACOCZU_00605 [Planctomycetota bacterium]